MTTLVDFFIDGAPRSTQTGSIGMRTIHVRGSWGQKVPKSVPYPTRRNLGWIDEFTLKAKRFRPPTVLTGPLELELVFFRRLPASVRVHGKPTIDLPLVPVGWADVDDLAKGIVDAMQGEFFVNDALCSDMVFRKRWVGWRGYPEGVLVRLSRVEATDVA